MKLLDKIIKRAKEVIGKGEQPIPKPSLARTKMDAEGKLKKLLRKEESLEAEVKFYRNKAKAALSEGNTREYNLNNAQFKRASGGLKMASAAVDSARGMIGIMDSQESLGDIVDISNTMSDMKEVLGIDPEMMQDAAFNIRDSVSNAEAISETMNSITEMVNGGDSLEIGDPLKAELMAEIQAESEANGFGKQIQAEMKELE